MSKVDIKKEAIRFNLRLTAGVLKDIEELRAERPHKLASARLGISTHDWMLEAIAEKMERERKKFNITAT